MELDLQSLFGLHVHSGTHWLRPRNRPPPLIMADAIEKIQEKRLCISLLAPPWSGERCGVNM